MPWSWEKDLQGNYCAYLGCYCYVFPTPKTAITLDGSQFKFGKDYPAFRWKMPLEVQVVKFYTLVCSGLGGIMAEYLGETWGLRSGFHTGKACESLCCWFCSSCFSLVPSLAGHTDLAYPAWLNTQPTGWFLSDTCSPAGPTNTHNYTSAHSPPTGMSIMCVHTCLCLHIFFFLQVPHCMNTFSDSANVFDVRFNFLIWNCMLRWIKCIQFCFSLLIIF